MTRPPSTVPYPARLWPPLRTASSSPPSRAALTTAATSSAPATRATASGRLSIPLKTTCRASSYEESSAVISSPRELRSKLVDRAFPDLFAVDATAAPFVLSEVSIPDNQ